MMTALFILVGGGALVCLGMIVELIGRGMFASWAFRFGPLVLSDTCSNFEASAPGEIGATGVTRSGVYRWVSNERFLFRPRFFGTHTFHTALPVGGTATMVGRTLRAEGRVPVGSSLFFAVWFAWLVCFAIAAAQIGNPLVGIFGLIVFGPLGAGFVWFMLRVEIRRAKRILAEIQSDLAEQLEERE